MKRLFWTAMGVTVGVLATRKATRAVEALTPAGLSDRLAGSITTLGGAVREFGQDVRDAMWDREDALYEALGLNDVPADPIRPR
jgi:poly(3-hydroxybutyrate) depolymerase